MNINEFKDNDLYKNVFEKDNINMLNTFEKENKVFNDVIDTLDPHSKFLDVTIEDLAKEFDKFKGNYMDVIQQFSNMEERDQKLFILYSVFYFNLKFYRENADGIMTAEVLSEAKKLSAEFAKDGSHIGCVLECYFSIYGPCISGRGYNISVPIKSKTCIRDLNFLSIMDLSNFADSGYSAQTEEERFYQDLNQQRNEELFAFKELLRALINSKKI